MNNNSKVIKSKFHEVQQNIGRFLVVCSALSLLSNGMELLQETTV